MARKPKTIEITLRVRVPQSMSAARARHIVSDNWYGQIYTAGRPDDACDTLHPRWGKARVVKGVL